MHSTSGVVHMLLGIKWYQCVRNDDVRRLKKQPKLTAIIHSLWLTLSRHIMHVDDIAGAKRILVVPLQRTGEDNQVVPTSWLSTRPTGSEKTPPYASRSSRFGSEPPSAEDDVDIWRYAILELHTRNDDDDDYLTLHKN